jgi:polysaccharide deacetylase 2 family uncharacterized protein YibQ
MAASGGRTRRKKTKRKSTTPVWKPLAGIAGAALLAVLILFWVLRTEGPEIADGSGGVEGRLRALASAHGVESADLEMDLDIRKIDGVFVRSWSLRFPSTASREEFIAEVAILDDRDDVSVGEPEVRVGRAVGLRVDHGVEAFDLELRLAQDQHGYSKPESIVVPTPVKRPAATPTPRPAPPPGARGRMAILLDDAGQQIQLVPQATSLPREVGVAVLPFLPYSTETAVEVHEAGHEVWLHLPMEAVGDNDPGPGALMTDMSDDELRDAVFMAINNIPHLVGVNNHMGSLATADLRMMTWVMQDLAAMDLAFIDSRTTVQTVAETAARAQGVKAGRRHVFLDNERSPSAIRAQLEEAIYRSRMEGEIIAIGHLNEVTVAVLADELPKLEERGVTLVRPTDLLD